MDDSTLRRYLAWKYRRRVPVSDEDGLTSPREVYRDLVKSDFAPALRSVGLRGSNGRFKLPSTVCWAQLGFQKSWFSDRQEVRFTVNLSFVTTDEWERKRAELPHLPAAPAPTVRYWLGQTVERIGWLTRSAPTSGGR